MAAKRKTKTKTKTGKKAKKSAKTSMTRKRRQANKSDKIIAGFKKLSVITLVFLLFVWVMGWYILSDGPARTASWLHQKAVTISADIGFTVNDILLEGRKNADADAILAVINVRKSDPLFSFIPAEAKAQIQRIDWVKSVYVERRLPDKIYINIKERRPAALWRSDDVLSLIDDQGNIITQDPAELKKFKELMMVQGTGAPQEAARLLALLKDFPKLYEMIDHAVFLDKRRWDIILPGDKRIKLPKDNVMAALEHIMERQKQNNLLKNEILTEIDARYKDRLIVRTRPGGVQDYKAGVK